MRRISGRLAGGGAFLLLALACNLDKGPTAPRAQLRADQVAAAVSSFVCDVDGAIWEGDPDAAVLHDLAPSGVMRMAFNYNNRNNAARDPIKGALTGPGIDMSCKLAQGTHAQFVAVPFNGVPPLRGGPPPGEGERALPLHQTLDPPRITPGPPPHTLGETHPGPGAPPVLQVRAHEG